MLVLGACGDDDTASTPSAADLDGRNFEAFEIEGYEIVEGSNVFLTFVEGDIVVNAGCNTQRASYSVDGDGTLEVGEMAATLMACDDELMAQDELVVAIVSDSPTLSLEENTLTVDGGDDAVMRLAARA